MCREEGERVKREREVLERNKEKLEMFGREIQQRSQEVEEMCKVCGVCVCVWEEGGGCVSGFQIDTIKNGVKGCLYSLYSFPY